MEQCMDLYPVGTCQHTEVGNVKIEVEFSPCPVGFADQWGRKMFDIGGAEFIQ